MWTECSSEVRSESHSHTRSDHAGKVPGQIQVLPTFLPGQGGKESPTGAVLGGLLYPGQGTHPPPLLLLQLVVADLLALQVQLGVLQLSR